MIIECPACRTRFRLDEARIKGRGARVRCRRCGEPIVVLKPEAPEPETAKIAGESLLDLRSVVQESMGEKPEESPAAFFAPSGLSGVKEESEPAPDETAREKEFAGFEREMQTPAPEEKETPPLPDLAVEFRPEEKIAIKAPAEPRGKEEEQGFVMRGEETLDFLKQEIDRGESPDISTALRKEPEGLPVPAEIFEPRLAGPAYEIPEETSPAASTLEPAAPAESEPAPAAPVTPRDEGEFQRLKLPPPRASAAPLVRPSLVALVLLFAALAGGGAYLGFTKGGQDILRGLVPGMESLWLRGAGKPGPQYDVRNLIGYYETNARAGNLFIIKGQVANMGRTRKSGIRIHAALLNGKDQPLAEKTSFAGTVLSSENLRTATREKIEEALSNRFGEKLVNMDVAPGKSVPFMVVFFDAPGGIGAYRLEAKDSD